MEFLNEWRTYLYYPLGIAPPLFFGLRFLVQWVRSEKAGISFVDATFWRLSLAGNLLAALHYSIQGQYPFALIQVGNGLIAWRNLNLMGQTPCSLSQTLRYFCAGFLLAILSIASLEWYAPSSTWIRIPAYPFFSGPQSPLLMWHLLGIVGQGLFASRFWIQWWRAEREQRTSLGLMFWYLSLSGALLSALYFTYIRDIVSCFNQLFGIIPYVRNLMLLKKIEKGIHVD